MSNNDQHFPWRRVLTILELWSRYFRRPELADGFKTISDQSERSSFSHVLEGNEDMTRRNNVMASQWHAIVKGMIEKTRPHLPASLRTLLPIWYKCAQPLYRAEGGAKLAKLELQFYQADAAAHEWGRIPEMGGCYLECQEWLAIGRCGSHCRYFLALLLFPLLCLHFFIICRYRFLPLPLLLCSIHESRQSLNGWRPSALGSQSAEFY